MKNTPANFPNPSILLNIANKLTHAQQELDELAVQLALGKAEATDKFEEIKKEFGARLASLKQTMKTNSSAMITADVAMKLAALEKQLMVGKAETKDLFENQKNKIVAAIVDLEHSIKAKLNDADFLYDMVNEFEKFKLKLEILRLRFFLKKFELKDGFREGMEEAGHEINNIWWGAKNKLTKARENYHDYQNEIIESYQHLKKALKNI